MINSLRRAHQIPIWKELQRQALVLETQMCAGTYLECRSFLKLRPERPPQLVFVAFLTGIFAHIPALGISGSFLCKCSFTHVHPPEESLGSISIYLIKTESLSFL